MSLASSASGLVNEFLLADRLRNQLESFVIVGPLKDVFQEQRDTYFKEFAATEADDDYAGVLDWFLFDWFDDSGEGVVDYYLSANQDLRSEEMEILQDWQDSLNSAFQIRSVSAKALRLRDLDSGYDLDVTLTKPESHQLFNKGEFVVARLLPLGDHIILSGLQFVLPDKKTALEWLELKDKIDELHSPEEIERAVQENCSAFCELFGCDELSVPSSKLMSTLKRFQEYLLRERRDPETGTTAAERYRAELGHELEVTDLPMPAQMFPEAQDVTILCDDFDGMVLLPDYSHFKRIFATDDPEKMVPDWKELVWAYIKNPDIPTVAFERVAEQDPKRVEKVLRAVLNDNEFSIEHLYAVLLHYKEPVDGLDDLEDDRQLWDLFNGNTKEESIAAKPRSIRKKSKRTTASTPTKAAASRKRTQKARPGSAAQWSKKPKTAKAASLQTRKAKTASRSKITASSAKASAKSGSRRRR